MKTEKTRKRAFGAREANIRNIGTSKWYLYYRGGGERCEGQSSDDVSGLLEALSETGFLTAATATSGCPQVPAAAGCKAQIRRTGIVELSPFSFLLCGLWHGDSSTLTQHTVCEKRPRLISFKQQSQAAHKGPRPSAEDSFPRDQWRCSVISTTGHDSPVSSLPKRRVW